MYRGGGQPSYITLNILLAESEAVETSDLHGEELNIADKNDNEYDSFVRYITIVDNGKLNLIKYCQAPASCFIICR